MNEHHETQPASITKSIVCELIIPMIMLNVGYTYLHLALREPWRMGSIKDFRFLPSICSCSCKCVRRWTGVPDGPHVEEVPTGPPWLK